MNRPSRSLPTLHVFFFAETFSLVDGWINDFQGRREMEKRKIKQAEKREAGREKRSLCERFRGWDWKCIKAKEGLAPTQNHLAISDSQDFELISRKKKKKAFTKTPLNTLDKVSIFESEWLRGRKNTSCVRYMKQVDVTVLQVYPEDKSNSVTLFTSVNFWVTSSNYRQLILC